MGDDILELCMKSEDGSVFHQKIMNTKQLCRRAQKVHCITQEQLLGCALWPQVAVELLDWIQRQCGITHTPIFVAHNAM
jgi:hypothetical protein